MNSRQPQSLPAPFPSGQRGKQFFRIGMRGTAKEFVPARRFHDFTCIHDAHPMRHFRRYGEIVVISKIDMPVLRAPRA